MGAETQYTPPPRLEREAPIEITVTPAQARTWLAGHVAMPGGHSHLYAHAMRRGEWEARADAPLVIHRTRGMQDGHNRLHAVILADRPIPFVVVWVRDVLA